jgi:hypothetical protein
MFGGHGVSSRNFKKILRLSASHDCGAEFFWDFQDFHDFQDFQGFAQRKLRPDKKKDFIHFLYRFLTGFPTGQTTGAEKCKNMVKIEEK